MKTALAFLYTKTTKNSINALLGAMEKEKVALPVYFLKEKEKVKERLKEILKKGKYKKIILALSFCTPQVFEIKSFLLKLKEIKENLFILGGGPHPTGDPKGSLKLGFDVIFVGEGEKTFTQFLKNFKNGKDWKKIKGIAFFERGKYIFTGFQKPISLDDYPPFSLKLKKFGPIEIQRGCFFACRFCQASFLYHAPPRQRSIENILFWVEKLIENKKTDIRFISPNAFGFGSEDGKTLNLEKLEFLLKSIKKILKTKGRVFFGSFPSEVRPEHVTKETLSLIKKYASNDNIIIGAQSGSERILEKCNRSHTINDVIKAVKLARKFDFKINVDFIFGLPGEKKKDMEKSLKLAEKLISLGAKIHAHAFMPLAGTPFAKEKPSPIPEEISLKLQRLASKQKLYGKWQTQQKLAQKIWEMTKRKK